MAIPAGHDQVRPLVSHKLKELGRNRPAWWAPDLVCDNDPVAHEIAGHVCQSFLGLRVAFMLANFEEQYLFRLLQQGECVAHGAAAFSGILPRYDHPPKLERTGGVGHQQNRAACPQQNRAGVMVVAAAPSPDDEQIRRSCFPQQQLSGRVQHAAPFDLFEPSTLVAELFAPLLETRHYLLKVVLAGFGQPDISGHEGRPYRATGNPDQRSPEAVGQAHCELDPWLTIVIELDMYHHRRKRRVRFGFAFHDAAQRLQTFA